MDFAGICFSENIDLGRQVVILCFVSKYYLNNEQITIIEPNMTVHFFGSRNIFY